MKIHYVSGSRADFGLMKRLLTEVHQSANFELGILVTAQHTNSKYGDTKQDIVASGLPVIHQVPVDLTGQSGAEMALAMARELEGLVQFWAEDRPDLVLLLGDRGEMLAAALAAMHLNLHIGHIGGGERSGTLDESFRHAISKIAHFHFTTTEQASDRLVRMGERPEDIFIIGAPGLVALDEERDRSWLNNQFSIGATQKAALILFHPVVQQASEAARQFREVVDAVLQRDYIAMIFRPNSDAGGEQIERELNLMAGRDGVIFVTHLERSDYCRALASVDLMIGNSSSGIIESASLSIPCINVGSRQNGRERNRNTIDCEEVSAPELHAAITSAEDLVLTDHNIYGTGDAHKRFLEILGELELAPEKLDKMNAY